MTTNRNVQVLVPNVDGDRPGEGGLLRIVFLGIRSFRRPSDSGSISAPDRCSSFGTSADDDAGGGIVVVFVGARCRP